MHGQGAALRPAAGRLSFSAPISGSDLPYMARTDLHGYIHIELMAPIYMATVALLPKHDHAYAAHTV